MPTRSAALLLLALAPLAACTWEGRPDGAEAVHTDGDRYFDDGNAVTHTPLGGTAGTLPDAAEVVEPLPTGDPGAAPVPTDQPAPTTGTDDEVSAVEEALTPGGQ